MKQPGNGPLQAIADGPQHLPLLEIDLTVQCHAPNNIRAMILVLIGDRWAVPPITSNSPIGNAIAAGRPTACENKCCVAAILESLGSFSHKS